MMAMLAWVILAAAVATPVLAALVFHRELVRDRAMLAAAYDMGARLTKAKGHSPVHLPK